MTGFSNPLVGGGGALVYPSIHSPNYVPGSVGWTIRKDGSVEFSSGVFRGVVSAGGSVFGKLTILSPSGDVTGATDKGNLNTVLSGGGSVIMTPGTWYIAPAVTIPPAHMVITTPDVIINGVGTGDVFRQFQTSTTITPGVTPIGGGIIGNGIIDISGMGNGSAGVHAGDIYRLHYEIGVRGAALSGPASKNFWFDNQYLFAEQLSGQIWSEQGPVVFDNSANVSGSATGSFDRANLVIWCNNKGKSDLVVLQNGAIIIDPVLFAIYGNTDYGSALFYVLKLTGSNVANGFSRIAGGTVGIGVECNATVGTQPGTIDFGSGGSNTILNCTGIIDFAGNNPFAAANNAFGSLQFEGPVLGDGQLTRSLGTGTRAFKNTVALVSGSEIFNRYSAKTDVITNTDVTGIILEGFPPDSDRILTVVNKGSGNITFDVDGTSHVKNGTSVVIRPNTGALFQWDNDEALWYLIGVTERLSLHITADQLINSTSTAIVGANSTLLSFPMAAGVSYRFHAVVYWTQGATQAQQAFRVIGTGGLALGNMRIAVNQTEQSAGGESVFTDVLATLNTDTANTGASGFPAGADVVTEFDGMVTPNVAGTFNLEARCATSNADTYTIRSWSFAEVMPE